MKRRQKHPSSGQIYLFFIRDPRSSSEAQSLKPEWWFLLSRAEQKAAMKMIDSLYQTTPDLTWENKWKVAEAGLREGR